MFVLILVMFIFDTTNFSYIEYILFEFL